MAGEYTGAEVLGALLGGLIVGGLAGAALGQRAERERSAERVMAAWYDGIGRGKALGEIDERLGPAKAREAKARDEGRAAGLVEGWRERGEARKRVEAQDREWSRTLPDGTRR